MSDVLRSAALSIPEDTRVDTRTLLIQVERAAADAVSKLKPGRLASTAVHKVLERLVLTDPLMEEASSRVSGSAKSAVARHLHAGRLIEDAIKKTNTAHAEALSQAGVPLVVLELLQSWVEVTVDARVVQRQIQLRSAIEEVQEDIAQRQRQALSAADPAQPLSATEVGQALGGLSDETVRQRERAGELFSVLRPGRKRGREYPAFQTWPDIAGKPLAQVLGALGRASGTAAYGFFTSPTDLLGGLTPIETLTGKLTNPRDLEPEAQELLSADAVERLKAVISGAQAYAAALAA